MGDFIIIALLVSSFWLLLELLRTAGIEKMKREEISLPAQKELYAGVCP